MELEFLAFFQLQMQLKVPLNYSNLMSLKLIK